MLSHLMDPALSDPDMIVELERRIKGVSDNLEQVGSSQFVSQIDFGEGREEAIVTLHPVPYEEKSQGEIPPELAAALYYASFAQPDDFIKERVTGGGFIMHEYTFSTKEGGGFRDVDLGS